MKERFKELEGRKERFKDTENRTFVTLYEASKLISEPMTETYRLWETRGWHNFGRKDKQPYHLFDPAIVSQWAYCLYRLERSKRLEVRWVPWRAAEAAAAFGLTKASFNHAMGKGLMPYYQIPPGLSLANNRPRLKWAFAFNPLELHGWAETHGKIISISDGFKVSNVPMLHEQDTANPCLRGAWTPTRGELSQGSRRIFTGPILGQLLDYSRGNLQLPPRRTSPLGKPYRTRMAEETNP